MKTIAGVLFIGALGLPPMHFGTKDLIRGGLPDPGGPVDPETRCGRAANGECVSNHPNKPPCGTVPEFVGGSMNGVSRGPGNNYCNSFNGAAEHCLNGYPEPVENPDCDPPVK